MSNCVSVIGNVSENASWLSAYFNPPMDINRRTVDMATRVGVFKQDAKPLTSLIQPTQAGGEIGESREDTASRGIHAIWQRRDNPDEKNSAVYSRNIAPGYIRK